MLQAFMCVTAAKFNQANLMHVRAYLTKKTEAANILMHASRYHLLTHNILF